MKPSIANAQSSDRNSSWQSEVKDPEHALFARARALQEVIADVAMDEARGTLQEETKFVKEATKAAYPTTEEVYQDKAAVEADPRLQSHRSKHKDSHVQQMAALFPSKYNPTL